MTQFWLTWKYLSSGKRYFNVTSFFAIFGIALGVACLVVAMAVVSGFESSLKSSVIDLSGHVNVYKRGANLSADEEFLTKIPEHFPSYVAHTPYVRVEAMVAHRRVISGVVLEGVELQTVGKVLKIHKRLIEGRFDLERNEEVSSALIGRGIAKRFQLKVGDQFKLILPVLSDLNPNVFSPRAKNFRVKGILSLGKYQYDERVILTDLATAQEIREIPEEYSGIKILLREDDVAATEASLFERTMGYPYRAQDWVENNVNLLSAVKNEKWVIFFVVLIMVVAACFNVSSHLFVSVLKKYGDISILKTLGAGTRFIAWLFSIQGLVLGAIGAVLGMFLGIIMSFLFVWVQEKWEIMPGEVYKLGTIGVDLRLEDLALVLFASILICFLATLAPAIRGARLNPVEGLRYE